MNALVSPAPPAVPPSPVNPSIVAGSRSRPTISVFGADETAGAACPDPLGALGVPGAQEITTALIVSSASATAVFRTSMSGPLPGALFSVGSVARPLGTVKPAHPSVLYSPRSRG